MTDFKGKVVLVTGGSRGIGAAIAREFADAGASFVITYRSDKRSAELCMSNFRQKGGKCLILKSNAERASSVRRAVKKILRKFHRVDILVNNAGIWKAAEIGSMSERQWDETIEINLKGTFLYCNEIAPIMKNKGVEKSSIFPALPVNEVSLTTRTMPRQKEG